MPIAPTIYTEALEQQLSLSRAVDGPMGEAALGAFGQQITQNFAAAGMRSSTGHNVLARMIAHATPYFWCAPLCQVLRVTARTIPEYTFTKASFPTPNGYVWLQDPVPLIERLPGHFMRTAMTVNVVGDAAHDWQPDAQSYESPFVLRAWSWHSVPDHGAVLLWAYIPAFERQAGVPMLQAVVEYGQTLPAAMDAADTREHVEQDKPLSPENEATRAELREQMQHAFMSIAAASLSFLEQRLVLATPSLVPRASRRRLERAKLQDVTPSVRVVELRTPHYEHIDNGTDQPQPAAEDAPAREYHYQWFVRGHWQRHWWPKEQVHKPTWIAPYRKGQPSAPLKAPATTVYAVKR